MNNCELLKTRNIIRSRHYNWKNGGRNRWIIKRVRIKEVKRKWVSIYKNKGRRAGASECKRSKSTSIESADKRQVVKQIKRVDRVKQAIFGRWRKHIKEASRSDRRAERNDCSMWCWNPRETQIIRGIGPSENRSCSDWETSRVREREGEYGWWSCIDRRTRINFGRLDNSNGGTSA